jgi:N-acetylneuraminic acid mutarotase
LPYTSSYGSVGVAASSNWPLARGGYGAWSDGASKVWIFGGNGPSWGDLNDLWEYDLVTKQWTWSSGSSTSPGIGSMGSKGVADPTNSPPPRAAQQQWIGKDGNLYMYGGFSQPCPGSRSDMWKYDLTTRQWVWLSGTTGCNAAVVYGTKGVADAANTPGGRFNARNWVSADGRLWLMGGSGRRNDLWAYDLTTLQWTWMGGDTSTNPAGVYGTVGVSSASNWPGARENSCMAMRSDGAVYLFGGTGQGASGGAGQLGDLWLLDPVGLQWTWLAGPQTVNDAGVYTGAASARRPGARYGGACWVDAADRLWLFAGGGMDGSGDAVVHVLNDLWMYDPASGLWAFVAGAAVGDDVGATTAVGEATFAAWPGGRKDVIGVPVQGGRVWVFGGTGLTAGNAVRANLNDVWSIPVPGL